MKRYKVEFDNNTGYCQLKENNLIIKEFAGVSQLLAYCKQNKIEIAIEDCCCSIIKNY